MYDDDGDGPEPEIVQEKISSLGGKCTIGVENAPSTGRRHLHVYAEKTPAFNTRDQKIFDIFIYHPNIKVISNNHQRTWDYVTKGGDVPVMDVPRPEKRSNKRTRDDEVFTTGLQAGSSEEMLRIIRQGAPTRYCTSFANVHAAARHTFPRPSGPPYFSPTGLQIDIGGLDDLQGWINDFIPQAFPRDQRDSASVTTATPSLTDASTGDSESRSGTESSQMGSPPESSEFAVDVLDLDEQFRYAQKKRRCDLPLNQPQARPKSLVLWGPTRTGKTLFARSLGRHIYHATEFNLSVHDDTMDYAIFDDMKDGLVTKGFNYKCWLGGQHQFNCTDKYAHKQVVVWGKPSIYIANQNPFDSKRADIDLDWLRDNTVTVHIDRPIAWVV
jgi:hypothetical protein